MANELYSALPMPTGVASPITLTRTPMTSGLESMSINAAFPSDTNAYDRDYENYLAYCVRYANPSSSSSPSSSSVATGYNIHSPIGAIHPPAPSSSSSYSSSLMSPSPAGSSINFSSSSSMTLNGFDRPCASSVSPLPHTTSAPLSLPRSPLHLGQSMQMNSQHPVNQINARFASTHLYDSSSTDALPTERFDRLDSSSCDSFPLDRSPGPVVTSESDCETWIGSEAGQDRHIHHNHLNQNHTHHHLGSTCPITKDHQSISYNWKKRKLRVLTNVEKENQLTLLLGNQNDAGFGDDTTSDDGDCSDCIQGCHGGSDCLAECGSNQIDARIAKRQRFDEILNAAARIMRSPSYRLDRLERLSEGARHSQRLEALKWQFFGISKLSRAFLEIGAYRRLRDSQRRALLKANCTELLMLSSARYFDPQSECWRIHVRLHPSSSNASSPSMQLPVPVNVMDVGQAQELSQLYLRFMHQFDRRWLDDDVLMTLVFVIALFCPDARLCRQICHIR